MNGGEGMIDETKTIHTQVYDDEHEEWIDKEMTIAEYLDAYTEEGCPESKPQSCGNAVDREAVCEYIAEFVNHEYSTEDECNLVDMIISGIRFLPSVTPARKKGENR